MKYIIKILGFIVLFSCLHGVRADVNVNRFSKSGANIFVITEKGNATKIKLDIAIKDWQIDCSKTRAVIWGKTLKKVATGTAPFTKFYILNISNKSVLNSYTRTLRVYGNVEFDNAGDLIVIDEDVVDFKTGMLKQTEPPSNIDTQICADFPGRKSL